MSDDMKKLQSRLETVLIEDNGGNGLFSPGLKVALWELERIDKHVTRRDKKE
ncbi:hypothetical protein [Lentilactobacillus hilgardii]|uniref:hypothetical protein n=1 Tax=Lentilactobacillus hilgardii TaxID=1588 RepID=UPI0021A30558|nr:hypothetical protein [Lentilactobacillus hilgardii]